MSLSRYCLIIGIASLSCWIALGMIVLFIHPNEIGVLGYIFFTITLFCAVAGTVTVGGLMTRSLLGVDDVIGRCLGLSLRQGIIFALIVVLSVWMSHANLLRWWNITMLVIAMTLIEAVFVKAGQKKRYGVAR